MNLEEIKERRKANYVVYSDWNGIPSLNAEHLAKDDMDWLITEIERLRKECKRWVELRIQHNEQYHDCVLRAEDAKARVKELEEALPKAKWFEAIADFILIHGNLSDACGITVLSIRNKAEDARRLLKETTVT